MRACLVLALLPLAAQAEPVSLRGYFTGCDPEGEPVYCYVTAAGMGLAVSPDTATPPELYDQLAALPMLAPVEVAGDLTEMGDSTAELALTSLRPVPDDPYVATLQALQGDWQPEGEETPVTFTIDALDWLEFQDDELQDSLQITPGAACADGRPRDGMVLSLYRYGDDPGEDACWRVVSAEADRIVLQDEAGAQGQVTFLRVVAD